LFKLKQDGLVATYQTEFERLSNCVVGLPHTALLNCFMSGLRPDIQQEIAIYHPTTLHQTYGLAKLIEDKLAATQSQFTSSTRPPFIAPTTQTTTTQSVANPPAILPKPVEQTTPLPTRLAMISSKLVSFHSSTYHRIPNPHFRADVVLGMSWLSRLGVVKADFLVPQITFNHLDKEVMLRGESSPKLGTSTDLEDKVIVLQEGIDMNMIEPVKAKAAQIKNTDLRPNQVNITVKENQEKDKIRSKPDKNGKHVEAGKSLKQLQWVEEEKLNKTQKEWPKTQAQSKAIQVFKERR
nr:hypothetical protein [Tanacetum cinerariifolium]